MSPRIALLDYGMGNLRSAEKALERVGAAVERTGDPEVASGADGLVLPGVGAFPEAMRRLSGQGLDELCLDWSARSKPLLGICLGMQLLFSSSTENEGAEGLGLLGGEVRELDAPGRKVPHIGWEPMRWERPSHLAGERGEPETPFYFVHSLAAHPTRAEDVVGTADWGERFAAVVERGSIMGAQFHPEKSSAAGLRLLQNFVEACAPVAA